MKPWTRPAWAATEAEAELFLVAFFPGDAPPALRVERARHGVPDDEPPSGLQVTGHRRQDNAAWFDAFFSPEIRAFVGGDLDFDTVSAARSAQVARARFADPPDLRHLQWAWALTRAFVDMGALAVLDSHAIRWRSPAHVAELPADAPFAIEREITVVFEDQPTEGGWHVSHTRGLVKFARPDVILFGLGPDDAEAAGDVAWALAHGLAEGRVIHPGEAVRVHGKVFESRAYRPGAGDPDLGLDNVGLVLELHGGADRRR